MLSTLKANKTLNAIILSEDLGYSSATPRVAGMAVEAEFAPQPGCNIRTI